MTKNHTSVDKSIGIRLRNKRMSMGLSQEQLAEKLLIDSRDVDSYETGAKRFKAHLLLRLAIALDVSPVYFFGITDDVGRSPALEEPHRENVSVLTLPEQGLRLNRAFASIKNPDVREVIVGLVEKIATSYEARLRCSHGLQWATLRRGDCEHHKQTRLFHVAAWRQSNALADRRIGGRTRRLEGRKRVHNADEYMAAIAERVVRHLEPGGFVVMKRPSMGANSAQGRE